MAKVSIITMYAAAEMSKLQEYAVHRLNDISNDYNDSYSINWSHNGMNKRVLFRWYEGSRIAQSIVWFDESGKSGTIRRWTKHRSSCEGGVLSGVLSAISHAKGCRKVHLTEKELIQNSSHSISHTNPDAVIAEVNRDDREGVD